MYKIDWFYSDLTKKIKTTKTLVSFFQKIKNKYKTLNYKLHKNFTSNNIVINNKYFFILNKKIKLNTPSLSKIKINTSYIIPLIKPYITGNNSEINLYSQYTFLNLNTKLNKTRGKVFGSNFHKNYNHLWPFHTNFFLKKSSPQTPITARESKYQETINNNACKTLKTSFVLYYKKVPKLPFKKLLTTLLISNRVNISNNSPVKVYSLYSKYYNTFLSKSLLFFKKNNLIKLPPYNPKMNNKLLGIGSVGIEWKLISFLKNIRFSKKFTSDKNTNKILTKNNLNNFIISSLNILRGSVIFNKKISKKRPLLSLAKYRKVIKTFTPLNYILQNSLSAKSTFSYTKRKSFNIKQNNNLLTENTLVGILLAKKKFTNSKFFTNKTLLISFKSNKKHTLNFKTRFKQH
jgi:hypothetical protein